MRWKNHVSVGNLCITGILYCMCCCCACSASLLVQCFYTGLMGGEPQTEAAWMENGCNKFIPRVRMRSRGYVIVLYVALSLALMMGGAAHVEGWVSWRPINFCG